MKGAKPLDSDTPHPWSRGTAAAWLILTALTLGSMLVPAQSQAQSFSRFGEGGYAGPIRLGLPEKPGGFTFCRLWYNQVRREQGGLGWSTDYPRADRNLTLRLSELTTASIATWEDGEPGIAAMRATNPDLFRCPFLFASDAGTAGFDAQEIEALRAYLLKGGFLWVDDFWGDRAWDHFIGEMGKVLPGYEAVDLPLEHPLYSIVYDVYRIPQITALQFWYPGASTSERGEESAEPHIRAIVNEDGRLLVLMSHNTDLADGWEREADSSAFFAEFSPDAYAIGINVLVWIMTH